MEHAKDELGDETAEQASRVLADDDLAANKDRIACPFVQYVLLISYSEIYEKRSMHLPARQTNMRWPQCGDKHTMAGKSAAKVVFGKKTLVSEVILPLRMVTRDGSQSLASVAYLLHDTQGSRSSYLDRSDVEELV